MTLEFSTLYLNTVVQWDLTQMTKMPEYNTDSSVKRQQYGYVLNHTENDCESRSCEIHHVDHDKFQ